MNSAIEFYINHNWSINVKSVLKCGNKVNKKYWIEIYLKPDAFENMSVCAGCCLGLVDILSCS